MVLHALTAMQSFDGDDLHGAGGRVHLVAHRLPDETSRQRRNIGKGAGAGIGGQVLNVYDPWLEHVETSAALAELCERSRREGRPLYVLYGYHHANHTGRFAELFRELDDRRDFEPVARFPGIVTEFVYRVLRYTGRERGL